MELRSSSVAFELMEEAYRTACFDAAAIGLVAGAAVFFLADREVDRRAATAARTRPTSREILPPPPPSAL